MNILKIGVMLNLIASVINVGAVFTNYYMDNDFKAAIISGIFSLISILIAILLQLLDNNVGNKKRGYKTYEGYDFCKFMDR